VHDDDADDADDDIGTMPMHGDHTSTGNDGSAMVHQHLFVRLSIVVFI
jgi:hypothetical protein